MRLLFIAAVIASLASVATADPDYERRGAVALQQILHQPAPGPGLERARTGAPAWCAHAKSGEWEPWTAKDDLEQFRSSNYVNRLIELAVAVCAAPNDPLAQRVASEVEQDWINLTGLTEANAIVSLSARADVDGFAAARTNLCDALEPQGDSDTEAYALANAHAVLFFCQSDSPPEPPWFDHIEPPELPHLSRYLDRSGVDKDELVKLAWVLVEGWHEVVEKESVQHRVVPYTIDQFAFHELSDERVLRALDVAPYKGNSYARAFGLESLAQAHLLIARADAEVAKLTVDPSWKELLVTAPQRGAADWLAAAARNKAVLARSDAVERSFRDGEGRPCFKPLHADFLAVLRKMKHDNVRELVAQISDDPLAGLLLDRLVLCASREEPLLAQRYVTELAEDDHVMPGPTTAAYRAALDAYARLGDKLGVHSFDLPNLEERVAWPILAKLPGDYGANAEGTIARLARTGKGVRVTFVLTTQRRMGVECKDTDKIDRIEPGTGKVTYRQVCHNTGPFTLITSQKPTFVPNAYAAGLKPGRRIMFGPTGDSDATSIPAQIFNDAKGTRLVVLDGFVLE